MKISRGISRFIILIVVLLFTLPFTVTAQENSVETQAILDAETDINRLLWTGVGFTSPFLGCLGCIFGSELASRGAIVSSESTDGLTGFGTGVSDACSILFVGGGIGCIIGNSIPMIPVYFYPISPPPERLIGKTPEYVASYTNAYKTKTEQLRIKAASIGAGVGTGLLLGLMVVSLVVDE